MQKKLLHEHEGQRTFAVILETGEEAMRMLKQFIAEEKVSAAQITAIGALRRAGLAFFDWASKDYLQKAVDEQVEVASLIGDVALSPDGAPALHSDNATAAHSPVTS